MSRARASAWALITLAMKRPVARAARPSARPAVRMPLPTCKGWCVAFLVVGALWRAPEPWATLSILAGLAVVPACARIWELSSAGARQANGGFALRHAITVVLGLLALLSPGDHLLMVDSAYEPTRAFCNGMLARMGVRTTYYDPLIGTGIADLITPETKLIFLESPGSLTFEVQDVPAITAIARTRGVLTMLDNTWATPLLFPALAHGVDVTMMSLTKYAGGHSDVMMGSLTSTRAVWPKLRSATYQLGHAVSPDDCAMVLRGLRTLDVRMARHGANGLAVQTIGGGGGRGGGAAASSSGTIETQVTLGGSGGDGGNTYYTASVSAVTNSGSIVTFGADAAGIVAQSIGGGGGIGGKAGTSLGDAKNNGDGSNGSPTSVTGALGDVQADFAANGTGALANYAALGQLLTTTNALLGNTASVSATLGDGDDIGDLDDTSATGGDTDDDNESDSITLGVNIGGSGGGGGAAGLIAVTNSGTVATMGRHSDAIVVQAIGGGGGKGGAASTAASPDTGGSVNIGGNGGSSSDVDANNGGQPTVTNSGTVYTVGALSSGIVAQSIAGGGGIGGTSSVTMGSNSNERSIGFPINLGGLAKVANGLSETALVENTGTIETRGHDSYGIIAQSISGGGGIVKTLAADLDTGNGSANSASSKVFDLDLGLGADGTTTSGASGAVFVTNDVGGSITTSGDNGIGILAQSVAAGGGLALGGRPTGTTTTELLGSGTKTGSATQGSSANPADNQGVNVTVNGSIATSGAGGVGVFAQSVGGGGGIAGDIGNTMDFGGVGGGNVASSRIGSGGDITVTVSDGASITTTNKNAPGVIAQSVGGGGGWFAGDDYALVGTAGGNGTGGDVSITLDGTVNAGGSASAGIIAQSTGGADYHGTGAPGTVNVTIGTTGSLWGGDGGYLSNQASLYILGAGPGSGLSNSGVINNNGATQGYAVYVDPRVAAGNFTVTNQRNAYITGDVNLPSSNFLNYGNYFPLATVSLGDAALVNAGALDLTKGARTTRLTGDFRGTSKSRLVVGADFVKGTADRLAVSGSATLGGGVAVRPSTLVPSTATVLTASNPLDGQSLADATGAFLFDFTPKAADNTVTVTPSADFPTDGLSRDERSLARHLQRVWDGDHPETMAKGFAALAGVTAADDYAATLDRLASRQVGAIATARMETSRLFVANMQSCPVFEGSGLMLAETDCAWGRAITAHLDHDGSDGAAGFDNDATLLQFGGQRAIGDDLFLAGSVAWENARLKDDFGASADGDSWMAGLGVKYQSGPLLASATVDLGYGDFDTTRSFAVGSETYRATGAPDARNAGIHGRVAYELPYERFYLRPSLDLDASWIGLEGYDEKGAGDLDLAVDDSDSWVLSATPAVEIGTRVDLADDTVLRPFANVGSRFVSGNDWTVDASFRTAPDGAGRFSSEVDNPNAVATFGAGITVMTKGNLDLTAQYQGAVADGYTAQSGALKATWRF